MTSRALWLPLFWLFIVASRPLSLWFGGGLRVESSASYIEGSPFDRNLFLLLLFMGIAILARRRIDWTGMFRSNFWLAAFFLYCGLSALWSDYSFVSLKRWVKDVGNVVMVLIVVSEANPRQAITALLARSVYLTIPLSIVLMKYYPEFGRVVSSTWENTFCGVATDKNALGALAFVSGMFLLWDFLQTRKLRGRNMDRTDLLTRGLLLLMSLWTLYRANSSAADVCLCLGCACLLLVRVPFVRRQVKFLELYALAGIASIGLIYAASAMFQTVVEFLGEDITLTGRTELWKELIKEPINPLLGTGYQSFWMGPRAEVYWEEWIFHPNQAHNGYLETYLNGGFIGLFLLSMFILTTPKKMKNGIQEGDALMALRFSIFMVMLFYNLTEAMFSKMSPLWFLTMLAAVAYPTKYRFPLPQSALRPLNASV